MLIDAFGTPFFEGEETLDALQSRILSVADLPLKATPVPLRHQRSSMS